MSVIIFIAVIIYLILTLNYTIRYFKIKHVINNPIRLGYYEYPMTLGKKTSENYLEFRPRIYVKEIDRYTNGSSKIVIDKIEYMIPSSKEIHSKIDKYIRDDFSEVKETNTIIWLDSENEIKMIRKQKLNKITKRKFF